MTISWHCLEATEIDHELIWGWVSLATVLMVSTWIVRFGLPPVTCPFHAWTGLPCVTCGATRAFAALLRGDWQGSIRLNPMVGPASASAAVYVPYALIVSLLKLPRLRVRLRAHEQLALRYGLAASALAVWVFLIADGR
jgi:hypothetical protein